MERSTEKEVKDTESMEKGQFWQDSKTKTGEDIPDKMHGVGKSYGEGGNMWLGLLSSQTEEAQEWKEVKRAIKGVNKGVKEGGQDKRDGCERTTGVQRCGGWKSCGGCRAEIISEEGEEEKRARGGVFSRPRASGR